MEEDDDYSGDDAIEIRIASNFDHGNSLMNDKSLDTSQETSIDGLVNKSVK